MTNFRNLKIAINDQQPLDEVVGELERLGYVRTQKTPIEDRNTVATEDDGEFYIFSNDLLLEDFRPTTLAELKEM